MTPQPNQVYNDNGHRYRTDELGRTKTIEGWIKRERAPRNTTAQVKSGDEDRQATDDGGHGIKSSAGGSGEAVNITPMERDLNRGGHARYTEIPEEEKERANRGEHTKFFNPENYRDMERYIEYEIAQGNEVYFTKKNIFDTNSKRPSRYDVSLLIYKPGIDRPISRTFTFYNTDKEGRQRQRDEAREALTQEA